jgi:tRNA pseudouridine55 synthase
MLRSGILNVHKDKGLTSYRVVSTVRKGIGGGRVGHAGTLDPLATGVLVVLVGQAVRVQEYVMGLPKVYRTTIRLGETTDTYDAEGVVVASSPVDVEEAAVREALNTFVGEVEQTPPPFSAVKVGGERAYRLARQGKPVALASRPARVYRIEMVRYSPPDIDVEIECGSGTYIRSIAHDLGATLGCGGHVTALQRTRVGPFDIESAISLDALEEAIGAGSWDDLLLPLDLGLAHLPAVTLHIEDEKDIRHGREIAAAGLSLAPPGQKSDGLQARAYAEDGSLVGIVRYDAVANAWRPHKIFS